MFTYAFVFPQLYGDSHANTPKPHNFAVIVVESDLGTLRGGTMEKRERQLKPPAGARLAK